MSNLKTDTITPLGSTITVAGGITVGSAAYFSSGVTVASGLSVGSRAYFSSGVTMASTLQVVSFLGLGLTASSSTTARLHVYGASASDAYTGMNLGTVIISNAGNTRQIQMGTSTDHVWIEGWNPGVGGATLCLQPSGGSVQIGSAGAEFLNPSGSAPLFPARAWARITNGSLAAGGNVSTVSNPTTGSYGITFSTAMPSANYSVLVHATQNYLVSTGVPTINGFTFSVVNVSGTSVNATNISAVVFV